MDAEGGGNNDGDGYSDDDQVTEREGACNRFCASLCAFRPGKETLPFHSSNPCRLPTVHWCGTTFPSFLWERPPCNFSHWVFQTMEITQPWNPPYWELLTRRHHRIQFLAVRLSISLLFLSVWRTAIQEVNEESMGWMKDVPLAGQYLATYVGTRLVQNAVILCLRPVFVFALYTSVEWRRAHTEGWRRVVGFIGGHILDLALWAFFITIAYYLVLILRMYRCSVVFDGVIVPWLMYVLYTQLFVCAIIPLPVHYLLLNTFGCKSGHMAADAQPLMSQVEVQSS